MAKHIHQFQRRAIGKAKDYIVYACVQPNCSTYYSEEMILGKESRCNRCKDKVIFIKRNTSGKIPHKPHCPECTSEPKNPNLRRKASKVPHSSVVDFTKLLLE